MKKLENISTGEQKESKIRKLIDEILDIREEKMAFILQQKYMQVAILRDNEKRLERKIYSIYHSVLDQWDKNVNYGIELEKILIETFGFSPQSKQDLIQKLREQKLDNIFNVHPKVTEFSNVMQYELNQNERKGNWENFINRDSIMSELYHHLNKLEKTYNKDQDPELMKEYIADCANILLMLGNSYDFYT